MLDLCILSALTVVAGAVAVNLCAQRSQTGPFDCNRDHMLLYTLGKTGSSTFQQSFRHLCNGTSDFHSFPYVDRVQDKYPRAIKVHTEHDVAADFLSKASPKSKVWVATLVRNPFERFLSNFFQAHWSKYLDGGGTGAAEVKNEVVNQVVKDIHKASKHLFLNHTYSNFFIKWSKVVGIPILRENFDVNTKHIFAQIDQGATKRNVILLRAEDIRQWGSILAPYFPGFVLYSANQAENKPYAELYKHVQDSLFYTPKELATVTSNAKELHFYTQQEVETMLASLHISESEVP